MADLQLREFHPVKTDVNNYIISLIDEALSLEFINEEQHNNIKLKIVLFLQNNLYSFKKEGFSTIERDNLNKIETSVLYLLSLPLKHLSGNEQLNILLNNKIDDLYNQGIVKLQALYLEMRNIYLKLADNIFFTQNEYFQHTFQVDMRNCIHHCSGLLNKPNEIVDTIYGSKFLNFTYPIVIENSRQILIENANYYMRAFKYENDFLRLFNPKIAKDAVMEYYTELNINPDEDYVNLFEPIFLISLYLISKGADPSKLLNSPRNIFKNINIHQYLKSYPKDSYLNALNMILSYGEFSDEHKDYYIKAINALLA